MTLPLEKEEQVNKGGRPVGSSTKISKLQRISTKLNKMANEDAIPLLEKSLKGEKGIDKEQLASAKFVVTTAKQYHQAILAEKDALDKDKGKEDDGDVPEDDDNENAPARFSLKIVENRTT